MWVPEEKNVLRISAHAAAAAFLEISKHAMSTVLIIDEGSGGLRSNEHTPRTTGRLKVKAEEGFRIEGHLDTSRATSQTFLAVNLLLKWNFAQNPNLDIIIIIVFKSENFCIYYKVGQ